MWHKWLLLVIVTLALLMAVAMIAAGTGGG
jgi:hypothetical protein